MWRMMGAVVLVALIVGPMASGQSAGERNERVRVQDTQGVVTYATDFSKAFGADFLSAYRGDAKVEIPFELIASLRTGNVVDSRMDVSLILTSGRGMEIQVDRPEFETVYGGLTDYGNFRIRLEKIRLLEFNRLEKYDEEHGQRCEAGHIWYKETWRYCPYDGKALTPVRRRVPVAEEPQHR